MAYTYQAKQIMEVLQIFVKMAYKDARDSSKVRDATVCMLHRILNVGTVLLMSAFLVYSP